MKKILILICAAAMISQALIGCASVKEVEFTDVIGFCESVDLNKAVKQDALLLLTPSTYQEFVDEYFSQRDLPIEAPDEDEAVLYIQIPSETNEVNTYYVTSLEAVKNTLTVTIKKNNSVTNVHPATGFDGKFSWVMFIEADQQYLKDDMKIEFKEAS